MKSVSRTDGKEVECGWSRLDGTAASTQEMGPGSREEILDDHFEWNNEQNMSRSVRAVYICVILLCNSSMACATLLTYYGKT